MANLISDKEMEELTGAKSPVKQCEVLRTNGVRFIKRADSRPALSWEAYNRQMSSLGNETDKQIASGPRLEAV